MISTAKSRAIFALKLLQTDPSALGNPELLQAIAALLQRLHVSEVVPEVSFTFEDEPRSLDPKDWGRWGDDGGR